tara:strand:+ start:451 stop:1989 length:1539 start_codon:yes stop_codon:yes gene_type:complete
MARYGCTITVATGKIPSSQSNFSWVATEDNFPPAAIDGGLTSILNGGGNLRCYTDSTKLIQIPIEIPAGSFVTGVSPSIVVWGLSPTLNVGGTVYIEADTVATAQPAPSNTYGSEKVWVGSEDVRHGNTLADSSGNNADLTVSGAATSNNTGFNGGKAFDSNENQGFYTVAASTSGAITFKGWVNFNSFIAGAVDSGQRISGIYDGVDGVITSVTQADKFATYTFGGNDSAGAAAGTTLTTGSWIHAVVVFDPVAQTLTHYLNGNLNRQTTSYTNTSPVTNPTLAYGTSAVTIGIDGTDAKQQWCSTVYAAPTADFIKSEYNNQSSPSAFWTTGTWEDQDASITIIESTGTLNLSTQNPTIEFTGTITVEESTSTLNTTSQSPTITFTATLTIVESTQTINLTGFDPTITLTPPSTLVVVESTQSIDWTTQSPNITLSGTLTIEESTQTIDILTRRPVIQLGVPTYTQIFTGIEKSYEFTGTIKSYGFTGIIATSQIFSGTEKAATFSGVKQ